MQASKANRAKAADVPDVVDDDLSGVCPQLSFAEELTPDEGELHHLRRPRPVLCGPASLDVVGG